MPVTLAVVEVTSKPPDGSTAPSVSFDCVRRSVAKRRSEISESLQRFGQNDDELMRRLPMTATSTGLIRSMRCSSRRGRHQISDEPCPSSRSATQDLGNLAREAALGLRHPLEMAGLRLTYKGVSLVYHARPR